MRILYAVQATGNGHIGRARVMAAAFKQQNIQVDWMFSGRAKNAFFDMEIFGNYKIYDGLSFIIKNNKLDLFNTIKSADIFQFKRDYNAVDLSAYDLLINDFEPVTAWAAKTSDIKSIGLSHQSAFLYKIPYTKRNPLFNFIMQQYAPTKMPIGIHWQRFDKNIIPPIISQNPHKIEINKQQIVVYLPFYSTDEIIELFEGFGDYEFHVFHKDRPNGQFGHLTFHPFSRDVFDQYTAKCNGIISNAGFELPSEALQIGKKMLLEPIKGQFEQVSNANMLEKFGWSYICKKIQPKHIETWLNTQTATQMVWPDVANQFAAWVKRGELENISELSAELWQQVKT